MIGDWQQEHRLYRPPFVKDLVWAILSPQLMINPGEQPDNTAQFYSHAYRSILSQLQALDKDDTQLADYLQQGNDKRLGAHFERLWQFWLQLTPLYDCLGQNIQLNETSRTTNKTTNKTIGEFDLIVRNNQTQGIEHWELAIKFYLGIAELPENKNWLGPNRHDRLDLKQSKLMEKQLQLTSTEAAQCFFAERGWEVNRVRLISKGCLFNPICAALPPPQLVNPQHLQGQWLTHDQFLNLEQQLGEHQFAILDKSQWISMGSKNLLSYQQMAVKIRKEPPQHPVQLSMETPNLEHHRIFLTPPQWN